MTQTVNIQTKPPISVVDPDLDVHACAEAISGVSREIEKLRGSIQKVERELSAYQAIHRSLKFIIGLGAAGFITMMAFLVTTSIRTEQGLAYTRGLLRDHVTIGTHPQLSAAVASMSAEVRGIRTTMEAGFRSIERRIDREHSGRRTR